VVVTQADRYNQRFSHVVVAEVTSNLTNRGGPAFLFIDLSTPEGQATGLTQDSLVSCLHLAHLYQDRVDQVIGTLSASLLRQLDDCLKIALGLP
jgi:mRNA-degrading endonuclease toxin of MazEF toxin-antitoxin module